MMAPSVPQQMWFDNTDTANVITKIYDGNSWVTVTASGGGNSGDI